MRFAVVLILLSITVALEAAEAGRQDAAGTAAGKTLFAANCSFCHGATARGGAEGGPNLLESTLVRAEDNTNELADFLKVGRPGKGMPAFHFDTTKVNAIAAYLHSMMQAAPPLQDLAAQVLVGNAAAGKVFFNGDGQCSKCHSEDRDLKGIGSKYKPEILQGRLVLPIGDGGYPGYSPKESARVKVTVIDSKGGTISGLLLFLSDYAVTLVESSGQRRTVARHGDVPKIISDDPLEAHLDRQAILTDAQMHNLAAYLASLK